MKFCILALGFLEDIKISKCIQRKPAETKPAKGFQQDAARSVKTVMPVPSRPQQPWFGDLGWIGGSKVGRNHKWKVARVALNNIAEFVVW